MAACYLHRCPACGFEVKAWSDGHPYIVDDDGVRHFFYHPGERYVIDPILARSAWSQGKTRMEIEAEMPQHTGCLEEVLCCDCGEQAQADPDPKGFVCGRCGSRQAWDVIDLAGKPCPKCKAGRFPEEPEIGGIS